MPTTHALGTMKLYDNIRDIWPDEDADFSPWLVENIDLLGDTIGLTLEAVERESPVGGFSADLLARESNSSATAVIENQLGISDHDHLGKLIAYASGKESAYVIWIVQTAREEHRQAVRWLNEITYEGVGFFLLEIQLWQIDSSQLAPKFNLLEAPNGWAKSNKKPSCSLNGNSDKIKYNFWSDYRYYAFEDPTYSKEFRSHDPLPIRVYNLGIGSSDACIFLTCNTREDRVGVELNIHDDKDLFDDLEREKSKIEAQIGLPLEWSRLDNRKASRIRLECDKNFRDASKRTECFDWLMQYSLAFKRAFTPLL